MGAAQSNQSDIQGWEKVSGIQLPGQSGKTRKMEEKIAEFMNLTRNDNGEDDFNIMISSNSKLLVGQTSTRLHNDLGPAGAALPAEAVEENALEEYDSDSYSEASSDEYTVLKNGSTTWTSSIKKTPADIILGILEEEISMIVCCSNVPRFRKLVEILERLQKSRFFQRKINIWIDEAHKCIKLLKRPEFSRCLAFTKIARLTLVTASWDPIDKYFAVPRITYEFTHPAVYRSLHECEWRIVEPATVEAAEDEDDDVTGPFDNASGAPAYVQQIFAIPSLLERIEQPGKHWLIAGNSRTVTHDLIATALVERGWNGLVLNGKEKAVRFFDGTEPINFTEYNKDKLEPKEVLEKLFNEYPQLQDAPFFITGLNCIKEGITFQGHAFMLDGAILPNISSPSDAYQLGCRLNGNLKGLEIYPNYAKPLVITTSRMEQKIKKQENIAIYLPQILYDMAINLPTPFLKRQASRGKVNHDPSGTGYRIFKTYETFKKYTEMLGRRSQFKEMPDAGPYYPLHTVSVQSTRGGTSMPRYLTEVIDKIDLAYGGGGGMKTGFPCYLDIKRPETLVWVAVVHNTADIRRLCNYADTICPDESESFIGQAVDYSVVC